MLVYIPAPDGILWGISIINDQYYFCQSTVQAAPFPLDHTKLKLGIGGSEAMPG